MSVVLTVILAIIFGAIGYKLYKVKQVKQRLDWITSVPGWPIIGNILEFPSVTDTITDITRLHKTYGKTILMDFITHPNILSMDYDFIEFILSTTSILNKGLDYRFLDDWLGTGLLTSDGPKWKKRRRLITPAFHFKILEQFVEPMEKNGQILIEKLDKLVNEDSIDIYQYITLYALDVIYETAMGVPVNSQNNENVEYVQNVRKLLEIFMEKAFSYKGIKWLYPFTKSNRIEKEAINYVHSVTFNVIDARKESLKKQPMLKVEQENDYGEKKKMAFLDILLQSTVEGQPLSREDIREEVDTFMFEGHDTTASAISFALFALAQYQDIQELCLCEQKEIFGDDMLRKSTFADIQNMKYLECVIKETLRLFPSVPVYARITNEDTIYKGNVIPKGVSISIFAYGMMRNPEYYPDPEKFDPSRFDDSNLKTKPYAYIPFSAGPRNCIGQKFAMIEIKSVLSKILRHFHLLPTIPEHKLKLANFAVFKSISGINIRLAKRKY